MKSNSGKCFFELFLILRISPLLSFKIHSTIIKCHLSNSFGVTIAMLISKSSNRQHGCCKVCRLGDEPGEEDKEKSSLTSHP